MSPSSGLYLLGLKQCAALFLRDRSLTCCSLHWSHRVETPRSQLPISFRLPGWQRNAVFALWCPRVTGVHQGFHGVLSILHARKSSPGLVFALGCFYGYTFVTSQLLDVVWCLDYVFRNQPGLRQIGAPPHLPFYPEHQSGVKNGPVQLRTVFPPQFM